MTEDRKDRRTTGLFSEVYRAVYTDTGNAEYIGCYSSDADSLFESASAICIKLYAFRFGGSKTIDSGQNEYGAGVMGRHTII